MSRDRLVEAGLTETARAQKAVTRRAEGREFGVPAPSTRDFSKKAVIGVPNPSRNRPRRFRRSLARWRISVDELDGLIDPRTGKSLVHHKFSSRSLTATAPTALDLAHITGIALSDAWSILEALGVVILRRLQDGKASGIPFVGVIRVNYKENLRVANARPFIRGKRGVVRAGVSDKHLSEDGKEYVFPVHASPIVKFTRAVKRMVRDMATRTTKDDKVLHKGAKLEVIGKARYRGVGFDFLRSRKAGMSRPEIADDKED